MPKIEFANILRGTAALLVLISHYYGIFWSSRSFVAITTHTPILDKTAFPTPGYLEAINAVTPCGYLGHIGVGIFFIISGFVIPFSFQRMNWKGFFIARALRIYPTYAVGLTISLITIGIANYYFHQSSSFDLLHTLPFYLLGFLQLSGTAPIDPVVWTLEIEIKFYLLCMVMSHALREGSWRALLTPCVLTLLSVAVCLTGVANATSSVGMVATVIMSNTPFLNFMFIGVALNFFYRRTINLPAFSAFAAMSFFLFVSSIFLPGATAFSWAKNNADMDVALRIAETYFAAMFCFLMIYFNRDIFVKSRVGDFLASISYPLYITHQIPGYILMRILLPLGYAPAAILAFVTAVMILIAWLIHITVEIPTHALGRKLGYRNLP